jgi:hypothetical protein
MKSRAVLPESTSTSIAKSILVAYPARKPVLKIAVPRAALTSARNLLL